MEFPNAGVYLEIVPDRRLVFTDAYMEAWTPSEQPFMTLMLDFLPEDGGTLYRARLLHRSIADREHHEAMGFHQAGRRNRAIGGLAQNQTRGSEGRRP